MADDLYERIQRRAYEIWENEGRPEGAASRHWDQALDELAGEDEHETLQDLIVEDDRRTRNARGLQTSKPPMSKSRLGLRMSTRPLETLKGHSSTARVSSARVGSRRTLWNSGPRRFAAAREKSFDISLLSHKR
jgi:hypothetical protein